MQPDKKAVKSADMEKLSAYIAHLRQNPRLTYLFVELTNRCNLSCLHCGSSCDPSCTTSLDTGLLLRTLETVAQDFDPRTVMICLTGGEPMLHKDFFPIVRRIVELGFPWGITTNGTLINGENAKLLKQLRLQSVTVSIDGLAATHDALRNTPGAYDRTLRAISELNGVGLPVQVTTVIHTGNFCELDALYAQMCRLKVRYWRVINMEPIGRALEHPELLLSPDAFRQLLSFIREKRYSKSTPMEVLFGCSHYLSFDFEREVRDNYFICGSGIYVGSILCNGDIYSCLDIERRPELVQGNIAKDRFSTVWYEKFKEFRADRTQTSQRCRTCRERQFCRGDSTHTWDFTNNEPMFCMLEMGGCL